MLPCTNMGRFFFERSINRIDALSVAFGVGLMVAGHFIVAVGVIAAGTLISVLGEEHYGI